MVQIQPWVPVWLVLSDANIMIIVRHVNGMQYYAFLLSFNIGLSLCPIIIAWQYIHFNEEVLPWRFQCIACPRRMSCWRTWPLDPGTRASAGTATPAIIQGL